MEFFGLLALLLCCHLTVISRIADYAQALLAVLSALLSEPNTFDRLMRRRISAKYVEWSLSPNNRLDEAPLLLDQWVLQEKACACKQARGQPTTTPNSFTPDSAHSAA